MHLDGRAEEQARDAWTLAGQRLDEVRSRCIMAAFDPRHGGDRHKLRQEMTGATAAYLVALERFCRARARNGKVLP